MQVRVHANRVGYFVALLQLGEAWAGNEPATELPMLEAWASAGARDWQGREAAKIARIGDVVYNHADQHGYTGTAWTPRQRQVAHA